MTKSMARKVTRKYLDHSRQVHLLVPDDIADALELAYPIMNCGNCKMGAEDDEAPREDMLLCHFMTAPALSSENKEIGEITLAYVPSTYCCSSWQVNEAKMLRRDIL